jgi:hypothetical protein
MTTDWFRSIVVLGAAVLVVAGMTFGLAALIVPGAGAARVPDGSPDASDGGGVPGTPPPLGEGAGATIMVSGDYTGHLVLTREDTSDRYGLAGDDGRLIFDGESQIAQISFDGWEFFPDPDECTVTPGEGDAETGLATATFECPDLVEVRDKGVVTLSGEMRLANDMVGLAPDLPDPGGETTVGSETWAFADAYLFLFPQSIGGPADNFNMVLTDEDLDAALNFTYDVQTHSVDLASVERDGVLIATPPDACEIQITELGRFSPRAAAAHMLLSCAAVEVHGLGTVAIDGDLIIYQIDVSG